MAKAIINEAGATCLQNYVVQVGGKIRVIGGALY